MSKNETLNLEVFDNPEFGQMRILREGDKYLFCANDAAVALGYSNPRAALQRHCKGVAKRDTLTPGGVQSLSYIAEGDLYRLIIHSKLPSAEKFEHWVFEEVLPCIRKTGGYMTDNLLNELMNEPDIIYKVTSDMLKERGQRMRLEGEVKAAKPKVEYFDSFITAEDCTNIRTTAKEIQVPERQFVAWLLKNKYLYRTAKGYLIKKLFAMGLAVMMALSIPFSVSAAELEDAPIDESRTGSLTIYKYDLTNAEKDGVWDSSYVSTGVFDQTGVNDVLGGSGASLGNGETGYGYAIKGVEFSYLKVADIVTFSESENDSRTDSHVEILYAIDKTKGADFLKALNLADGKNRYTNADTLDSTKYFYQSDVLIDALAAALESNSTVVKNALEAYISANGGAAMPLTDSYGKTKAENLNLGLYLVVETKVPEMVVSTTDPFLVSVPMTSVNGTNATDGGTRWIYDITLYPKNLTGIPSLEKTLRENQNDTGKFDAYAHTGTASAGDTIDYQIISTLPSITSESTYLSCYTFVDTLSKGLTYNKGDVVLEFFTDAACMDSVAKWTEADGKFTVAYNTTDAGESVMTIEMTADGLTEINTSKAVYSGASMVNSGYSDCTLRITYAAKMDSSDLVFGDKGNDNKVVMTWKRSSQNYYDTLVDDCHVFSYGIDLTKLFSDGQGDFSKVEFLIQNKTDNYFVKAELNKNDGVYYVVDHVTDKADATHFVPVKTADAQGRIIIKGLEDDTYTLTEVRTDSGYVMLKQGIDVVISRKDTADSCGIYGSDVLGLIQNDPRYASIINDSGDLHNMPQKHLEHKLLTASATVDDKKVTMLEDNGSVNAEAPLTVVNTRGFDLPKTGDHGTWMYSIGGVLLMAVAASAMFFALRKKGSVN